MPIPAAGGKPIIGKWPGDDRAFLLSDNEQLVARLHLEKWFPDGQRVAQTAWVVSWLDPDAKSPQMLRALVELPARPADTDVRRNELLALSIDAMERGPSSPEPRASALAEPPSYGDRFHQIEVLIDAWDQAEGNLAAALRDEETYPFQIYSALSDVLARTYTVDRTLQGMWDGLPADLREDASARADERAEHAITHNAAVQRKFGRAYDPRNDVSFDAFFIRHSTFRPYSHWTGHLLSGSIQEGFFRGLKWIRGQMTYRGTIDPIELWQYEPGVEPRWKWKDAAAITTGLRSNWRERQQYECFQAGHDVLGLFSHLLTVFWDAKWSLRKLSKRAAVRRPGLPTRV